MNAVRALEGWVKTSSMSMHRDVGSGTNTTAMDAAKTAAVLARRQADDTDEKPAGTHHVGTGSGSYHFTYRPLSNLPTPPPTYRENRSVSPFASDDPADVEPSGSKFRGSAIHLVNLIPSSASLTPASVPEVQSLLNRADLPIETVALTVCILDSLDKKFSRAWRLSCPPHPGAPMSSSHVKRRSLPSATLLCRHQQRQMLHIDSVPPEIIVLAALVIAAKFTEDPQQQTQYYCEVWGRGKWSHDQLNVTERCIMESLDYRIMPLCDEDCLADAMVDMELAGQQLGWDARELTPPESVASNDCEIRFVPSHNRSKTMMDSTTTMSNGLGIPMNPPEPLGAEKLPKSP